MENYMFDLPVKVRFGTGAIRDLGEIAAEYGKKAFVLHDPFLSGQPMLEKILQQLAAQGLQTVCFDDVEPNPRCNTVDRAAELCRREGCDVIIGIGGGSAIDSAKAMALVVKNGGTAWEYTEREGEPMRTPDWGSVPLIAIPTTSGTGTETTPFAVLSNQDLHMKASVCQRACYPAVALLDPAIMASMPPSVTANTGIDAFAHALEAYISTVESPLTDELCLSAIRLFAQNIEKCVQDGQDLEARANMALCSLYAGIGIGHASTAMPHAIAQALGGYKDVPHGAAIATCILQVVRWTLPYAQEKLARIAELFDSSLEKLSEADRAAKLPEILDALFVRILNGKRLTMGAYGFTPEEADKLTDLVMTCYYGDCSVHPRVPQREDIKTVILQSI